MNVESKTICKKLRISAFRLGFLLLSKKKSDTIIWKSSHYIIIPLEEPFKSIFTVLEGDKSLFYCFTAVVQL